MSGYLDTYGAGEEKRERVVHALLRWGSLALLIAFVLFIVFHYVIPNRSEQASVKRFFALLAAKDYKQAYAMWGCTDQNPCRDYPMERFLEDWGPQAIPNPTAEVLDGESCGSGVIVDVDVSKVGDKRLWVEPGGAIGYPPPGMERCPQGNRIYDFFRNLRYKMRGRTYR